MHFAIHRHATIPSTSETAFEALAAGTARHGDVHVARSQTRGRGRQGRTWHSEEATGLYMSAILLPERALSPAGLTIAAGLAVLDAVVDAGLALARLKWPNDVVVKSAAGDAKLAGILVETRGLDPLLPHYVVGIGINVAQQDFPAALQAERPVASLRMQGIAIEVDALLERLLPHLSNRIAQIESDPRRLARDFLTAAELDAKRVSVTTGEQAHTGKIASFELDTGVVLIDEKGGAQRFALEVVREMRSA